MPEVLVLEDFARLFGADSGDFDEECREFVGNTDFSYNRLSPKERDQIILEILKRIDSGQLSKAGEEERDRWEKGWGENLEKFIDKGYDLAELLPKYVRPNQVLRLYREYVMPVDANFEINFYTILRLWLFKKYLKGFDATYEFGCGPGYNLPLMAKLYPNMNLYGLDWSKASNDTVNLLREKHDIKATGIFFDMFSPDYTLELEDNSVVITLGGLEQLGEKHHNFLEFLVKKSPRLCIHIEPIYRFYDENNLADYLAMKFHRNRNYLMNFLPCLLELESRNKVTVLNTNRMKFGSLFHDGWSLTVWKPNI
jgi:hypothetical protein